MRKSDGKIAGTGTGYKRRKAAAKESGRGLAIAESILGKREGKENFWFYHKAGCGLEETT